jgi:hypothetical protein
MDSKMNLTIKYKTNYDEMDRLINRYYDGLTTVAEEKQLRLLLSQKSLPERYKPEQAIFGYFETKKQKPTFSFQPYFRWVGAVAAVVLLMFGIQFFSSVSNPSYAYVDGVKITDKQMVRSVAENSMKEISGGVTESSKRIDAKEIMKQQLGAFSE